MASMRGFETQEQTLERLEQNRTRMASMKASETLHVKLHNKRKSKEAMANARTRSVPVEGVIAAFHSEVKLGPCTSVLGIVLHDIMINSLYIASLYTIFRIAHQGTFINPRRMRREGYCSCRVCLSVCLLFDNSLHEWLFASKTNTHIQRRMEVKKYVGFSLKLLRSRVMASFTHLE